MTTMRFRLFALLALMVLLLAATPLAAASPPLGLNPANLLQEAEALYRAQRYEEALRRYEQYLQTSPPEGQWQQAWLRTAELYGIRGDWAQARDRYERILTMKTDRSLALWARYGAGQANYKLGHHLEAERILENLSASSLPGDLRFKTNALLTELSLQAGNLTQAFSRLLLVAKDLPDGEEEWFQDLKTRLLSRANLPDLERMADLHRDAPLAPEVLLQLVKSSLQSDRPEKAATWLAALQQRFPASPEAAQAKQLAAAAAPAKLAAAPAVVGCLLPLSGEHAEFGRQVKNGMELAASQSGVALTIMDVGASSQKAAAAVEELAAKPQVLALVGFFPTTIADAAAAAAQRHRLPLLALTQKKDLTLDRPLVFRDFFTQALMLQALLDYTVDRQGWRRYAILHPDSKYGQSLARQFNEEAGRHAAQVVGQASYRDGGQDLAQAVRILAQITSGPEGQPPPEAIFIPDEPEVVAAAARELAVHPGLAPARRLGTNLLQNPAALTLSSQLAGILFADAFFAGDPDPAVRAFVADYRQQFQQTPAYLAAQGYSSLRLVAQVLKEAPELTREDFARNLQRQSQPPGFSLFKEFNLDREAVLTTKIITLRDQEFQSAP